MGEAVSIGEHQGVIGIEANGHLLTVHVAELRERPQKLAILDGRLVQTAVTRLDEPIEGVGNQVGKSRNAQRKIRIRNLVDVDGSGDGQLDAMIANILCFDNIVVGQGVLNSERPVLNVRAAPLVLHGVDIEANVGQRAQ